MAGYDQVQISVEGDDGNWRQRCHNRMERLKAKFPSIEEPPPDQLFGVKNSEIYDLQKVVQGGFVDRFVDKLEQLCSMKKQALSAIFDQVTHAGDSLLHVAAYFGNAKIAELIAHHFPRLLTKTNTVGDTPLHVAARSRSSPIIKAILYAHALKSASSTRIINEYGNTALHEAVECENYEGVTLLFEADKYGTHYRNKSGKSALYLAVLTSNKDIVNVLLEAPFPYDEPKCQGNSPLHAAIYIKNADLLEEMVKKKPEFMYRKDEHGGTPMHYAATTGYADGVRILLRESRLPTLEYNIRGHLPIHLAAKWGYVQVLKEFFKEDWVDPRVLLNKKGQNILHVAANNGKTFVVRYLLRQKGLIHILNKKDKKGNTPLHLAAKNSFPQAIFYLTQEKYIDMNITNNEGFTARDIILVGRDIPQTQRQWISNGILNIAGAKVSDKARNVVHKRRVHPKVEWIKDRLDALMLVTILIVTVTFAAGFTVPGSVFQSGDLAEEGMAVLSHRPLFKAFVATDTVALYSSVFGSMILLWAQYGDFNTAELCYRTALYLVGLALFSMTVAFMAAVSVILSHVPALKYFLMVTGMISSVIIFSAFPLGYVPVEVQKPRLRRIVTLALSLYMAPYVNPPKQKVKSPRDSASQNATAKVDTKLT